MKSHPGLEPTRCWHWSLSAGQSQFLQHIDADSREPVNGPSLKLHHELTSACKQSKTKTCITWVETDTKYERSTSRQMNNNETQTITFQKETFWKCSENVYFVQSGIKWLSVRPTKRQGAVYILVCPGSFKICSDRLIFFTPKITVFLKTFKANTGYSDHNIVHCRQCFQYLCYCKNPHFSNLAPQKTKSGAQISPSVQSVSTDH